MWSANQTRPSAESARDIVSSQHRQIFTIVNHIIICGSISVFGIVSNMINLIVFYKQGLETTINISFFAMALSDMWSLLFQMWYIVCDIPDFVALNLPIVYSEFQQLVGGVPRELFARVTCLITAYITAERCLCIAFPLQVKQVITPRRTVGVISLFVALTLGYVSPLLIVSYIDWRFYPGLNQTLLGAAALDNKEVVAGVVYIVHSITGVVSLGTVAVFTFILIRKLGQTSAWRKSIKGHEDDACSKRDRNTMMMVVLIAALLIVCYVPAVVLGVVRFVEPEFGVGGSYFNLYLVSWSFALVFETINSSVNIFFYYKMSSRFRQSLREIFLRNQPPA